jgi:hypothetical protein
VDNFSRFICNSLILKTGTIFSVLKVKTNQMLLRYDIWAVLAITGYLIASYLILIFSSWYLPGLIMILFSPALICLMVYVVLKYGAYKGNALGNKEYGYQDKMNNRM